MSDEFNDLLHRIEDPDPNHVAGPTQYCNGRSLLQMVRDDYDYAEWLLDKSRWGEDPYNKRAALAAFKKFSEECVKKHGLPALTAHQQSVLNELLASAQPGAYLRLEGGAGYGKSFVTWAAAHHFVTQDFRVHGAAVSKVATDVLKKQLDKVGAGAGTIASTFKFAKKTDFDTGEVKYDHGWQTPGRAIARLIGRNVLIIDECSMVQDRDAQLLIQTARANGGILLVVGDSHQLPPVKQATRSIFCGNADAVGTLSVPMRYDFDSRLFNLEQAMRANPWEALEDSSITSTGDGIARLRDTDTLLKTFLTNYLEHPDAAHRMLFYERNTAIDMNRRVRNVLYGYEYESVMEDEPLMVLRTEDVPLIGAPKATQEDPYSDRARLYSGEVYYVEYAEEQTGSDALPFWVNDQVFHIPHWMVWFKGLPYPVRMVLGSEEGHMDMTVLGSLEWSAAMRAAVQFGTEKPADWEAPPGVKPNDYWCYKDELNRTFAPMGYCYATTVHRAQGATLDYAYCVPHSLLQQPGLAGPALAYVATTRARKQMGLLLP